MIIQANQPIFNLAQNLKTGENSSGAPSSLGETFANEIARRMEPIQGEDGQVKDQTALKASLGASMDWIRSRFGDETAAAASGIILKATSGGISEETLGNGLLNSLKFIDRNFGFAAGDEAIARFNSGINGALNDYFENGFDEVFFAVQGSDAMLQPSPVQDMGERFFLERRSDIDSGKESRDSTLDLLEKLKQELDEKAQITAIEEQTGLQPSTFPINPAMVVNAYTSAM